MYLFIFEDGQVMVSEILSEDDMFNVGQGILEVINISDPSNPVTWFEGSWHTLKRV